MNEDFIRERISELRIRKNISEYKMSLDLGHSKGYIQSISSGRAMPSMSEFLYICKYFEISPKDFFDVNNDESIQLSQLYSSAKELPSEDLAALIYLANLLKSKEEQIRK
ncbi:MAG: helix-turn-helix transcriptional regulator [Lachnospiraceae bacterium]|jgi:transcriptional regulator with XRE-family HTH domain|nr:helix-turn-helix transcriptional regulator [Lachnospiraceae bacterium]